MSFASFEHFKLDSRLYRGITQAGYEVPTPIQAVAIPVALDGDDMIGTAQTGTGKTAAFVLPLLNKLLGCPRNKSQALIITPTRELAEQIHETICTLGTDTGIRSATIYGGVGAEPQIKALQDGVEILVACPGRLLDHINQKHAQLDNLKTLVLDEADRMFDMGFLPSVEEILTHLPSRRQNLLFSATFPPEIEKLGAKSLKNPKRIAVGISCPAYTVEHALYPVPQKLKTSLLKMILKKTPAESVLIFTRTKYRAKRLFIQIKHMGYKVTSIHGNRTQSQRHTALNGFKEGKYQIMVATDVAARGLDVESITHVINFDMPDTVEAYIHRIGRTGRARRKGDAFTLVTPEDNDKIKTLEKTMGKKLARQFLKNFDYDFKTDNIPQSQTGNGRRKTWKTINEKGIKPKGSRLRVNQEDSLQKRLDNKTNEGKAKPGKQNQETIDKRVKAKGL